MSAIDVRAIHSATELAAALRPHNPEARFARNGNDTCLAQWDDGKWRGLFAKLIGGLGWSVYPNVRGNGEPMVREDEWVEIANRCVESQPMGKPKNYLRLHVHGDERFVLIGPLYLKDAKAKAREHGTSKPLSRTEAYRLKSQTQCVGIFATVEEIQL